jgi:hypothetical protein
MCSHVTKQSPAHANQPKHIRSDSGQGVVDCGALEKQQETATKKRHGRPQLNASKLEGAGHGRTRTGGRGSGGGGAGVRAWG